MSKTKISKHKPSLIVLTLMILGTRSIGRYELSKYLNQSLAKTRALLDTLVSLKLAQTGGKSSGKKGTYLTNLGLRLYDVLTESFQFLVKPNLGTMKDEFIPNEEFYTMIYFNSEVSTITGLFERDLAVRNGAKGAITLIRKNKNWLFPDGFKLSHKIFEPIEGFSKFNLCIIVFGDTLGDSCMGAMAIVEYHIYEKFIKILTDYF